MTGPTAQSNTACERCDRDVNSAPHLAMCGHPLQPITADEIAGIRETYERGGVAALGYSQVARLLNEIDRIGTWADETIAKFKSACRISNEKRREAEKTRDAAVERSNEAKFRLGKAVIERDQQRDEAKRAHAERDAAIARAERAEAKLAELKGQLGDAENEWGYGHGPDDVDPIGDRSAAQDCARAYNARVFVRNVISGPWREADVALRIALEYAAGGQDDAMQRPVSPVGLIDTLKRVSGLTDGELGKLIGVSANAICLWSMGGRINQAHYDRVLDLNTRMQKLPSKTFYGRREALFNTSGGRSVYDQMLAELSAPALEPDGPAAYFETGQEEDDGTFNAGQVHHGALDPSTHALIAAATNGLPDVIEALLEREDEEGDADE